MSALVWVPQVGGFRSAVGARGTYRLRHDRDDRWHVSGIGHDGLPMLAIPPDGRMFASLRHAETFIDGLDRAPVTGELSGT